MSIQNFTRKRNKIFKETVDSMREIGTYRKEFDVTIKRYADIRVQYENQYLTWIENGCKVTESYTNKAGAENIRKTAEYLAIENLQKSLTDYETTLGLTPKGLKSLKTKGLENSKSSRLSEVLSSA